MRNTWGSAPNPSKMPVTIGLLVATVLGFLAIWIQPTVMPLLAMQADSVASRPWTLITWPAANLGFLAIVCGGVWLFQAGSIIERDVRSVRYAVALLTYILLTGGLTYAASLAFPTNAAVYGLFPLVAATTVAWASRDPLSQIRLFGIIPIQLRWMAWLSVGLLFFSAPPTIAPFLALPLLGVYLIAADKTPIPYSGRTWEKKKEKTKKDAEVIMFLDEVKRREKRREEDDRLKRLIEGGGDSDR